MRWAVLLLALAACGGDECVPLVGSRLSHGIGSISSGKQIAGVSWTESFERNRPVEHVAIVRPDGTLSPDIPSTSMFGVTGTTTVLWHRDSSDACAPGEKFEFNPLLYDGTTTTALTLAPVTRARTAVFDGTRYQLFWTVFASNGPQVFHRTLDEDGTLGAMHDLGLTRECAYAATDGNGTTLLVTEFDAYLVDSAGTKTQVWSTQIYEDIANVFYFAGRFYIDGQSFRSIDPVTQTTGSRQRPSGALRFHPTASKLFVLTATDIIELDTSFEVMGHTPRRGTNMQLGTIGDELLFLTQRPLDMADHDGPQRIAVERDDSSVWSTGLAVDSQTETLDACP